MKSDTAELKDRREKRNYYINEGHTEPSMGGREEGKQATSEKKERRKKTNRNIEEQRFLK